MKNLIINKDKYSELIITTTKKVKFVVLIDTEDVEKIQPYKWYMQKNYVACKKNNKNMYLHRFLINAPKELQVDHKNRNTLDNRKSNLRLCTQEENLRNKIVQKAQDKKSNISGQKYIYKSGDKWKVSITYGNKQIHIGTYITILEAKNVVNNILNNIIWNY